MRGGISSTPRSLPRNFRETSGKRMRFHLVHFSTRLTKLNHDSEVLELSFAASARWLDSLENLAEQIDRSRNHNRVARCTQGAGVGIREYSRHGILAQQRARLRR